MEDSLLPSQSHRKPKRCHGTVALPRPTGSACLLIASPNARSWAASHFHFPQSTRDSSLFVPAADLHAFRITAPPPAPYSTPAPGYGIAWRVPASYQMNSQNLGTGPHQVKSDYPVETAAQCC